VKKETQEAVGSVGFVERSPIVSVVVATYRRPDRCTRLLRALEAQTIPADDFEVIVIDDCSGDETGDVLASLVDEFPYRLRPMQTPANRGPGPARNIGWNAARAPVVAFTDDDCVPDPGWLAAGLEALSADSSLGFVQGRTVPEDMDAVKSDRWTYSLNPFHPDVHFETCNIFYRREALASGGGFGEDHNWWGGWYCEDTYAGWRAIDAGWSRGYAKDAVVTHEVAERSVRWWINKSLMLYVEVAVARRHPGFRKEAYWRPWAPRRLDAAFAMGATGLLLALKWRPAAILAIPYVWWGRPPIRHPNFWRRCAKTVAVDSARTVGILYGALRERTLVI
jgi:glycosyltransferase involved in cell wall biosynthesis